VPIGLLAVPLLLLRIGESHGPRRRPDPVGSILAAAAMLALVWGIVRSPAPGWAAGAAAGLLLGGVFVWWERRAAEPMLALALFRSRTFAFGNAASLLLYATLIGSVFFVSQFLQVSLGLTPSQAGLRMLPWTAAVLVVAPLSGRLVDRRGGRLPLVGGLAAQAAGLLWIAWRAAHGGGYGSFVVALAVAGIGVTAAMPAAQHAVFSAAGPAEVGRASGTFGTVRQLGGVLGVALMAAAFSAAAGAAPAPAEASFRAGLPAALGLAAALSAAGAVFGSLAYRRAATVERVAVLERV
jgi:MFS family permease